MRQRTIRGTDCGNCKHWHEWPEDRQKEYWRNNLFAGKEWSAGDLSFGDCDKVQSGTPFADGVYTYDGYSFEDENYDEEFHCFEKKEEAEKMAEQILTLCETCRDDLEIGGFRAKPVVGKSTTEAKKECENCGKRCGGDLKQYIVSKKRG